MNFGGVPSNVVGDTAAEGELTEIGGQGQLLDLEQASETLVEEGGKDGVQLYTVVGDSEEAVADLGVDECVPSQQLGVSGDLSSPAKGDLSL